MYRKNFYKSKPNPIPINDGSIEEEKKVLGYKCDTCNKVFLHKKSLVYHQVNNVCKKEKEDKLLYKKLKHEITLKYDKLLLDYKSKMKIEKASEINELKLKYLYFKN